MNLPRIEVEYYFKYPFLPDYQREATMSLFSTWMGDYRVKGGIINNMEGCPRVVMVKAQGCGIVVSEFELQSRDYVPFRTNTLGKGMNSLIQPANG